MLCHELSKWINFQLLFIGNTYRTHSHPLNLIEKWKDVNLQPSSTFPLSLSIFRNLGLHHFTEIVCNCFFVHRSAAGLEGLTRASRLQSLILWNPTLAVLTDSLRPHSPSYSSMVLPPCPWQTKHQVDPAVDLCLSWSHVFASVIPTQLSRTWTPCQRHSALPSSYMYICRSLYIDHLVLLVSPSMSPYWKRPRVLEIRNSILPS